jgi:hypothetical protein
MTLEYIFQSFRALETVAEKVTYLRELETLALPYEINFQALITAWELSE